MDYAFKKSQNRRFKIMERWNADRNSGSIHKEEHSQLVHKWAGTRFGICPKTIPDEIAEYGACE